MKKYFGFGIEITLSLLTLLFLVVSNIGADNMRRRAQTTSENYKQMYASIYDSDCYNAFGEKIKEGLQKVDDDTEFTFYAVDNFAIYLRVCSLLVGLFVLAFMIRATIKVMS
jgi:hypothetical protein